MAKLMVEIEIPKIPYEELVAIAFGKGTDWHDAKDPGMLLVDEAYLKRANCDDSFFAFKLMGVRP